jgi:hypothetical protein
LNNESPDNLFSSQNGDRSKDVKISGHVAHISEMRNAFKISVGKYEGEGPLEIPRRRRRGNIKVDLKEVLCGDVKWINLAQNKVQRLALVNTVMNVRVA